MKLHEVIQKIVFLSSAIQYVLNRMFSQLNRIPPSPSQLSMFGYIKVLVTAKLLSIMIYLGFLCSLYLIINMVHTINTQIVLENLNSYEQMFLHQENERRIHANQNPTKPFVLLLDYTL